MRARRPFRRRARRLAPGGRLIFVDEFGTNLGMTRRCARALRGRRAVGRAPVNSDPHVTLTMGLSRSGIVAPLAFVGAQNGHTFKAYVRTQLAPPLRPGDAVVVDGLGAHRSEAARAAVQSRGARYLILPPASPDLNPVEEAGAKVKAFVRSQAPRALPELLDAMGRGIERVTPDDALGWCQHRARYLFGSAMRI